MICNGEILERLRPGQREKAREGCDGWKFGKNATSVEVAASDKINTLSWHSFMRRSPNVAVLSLFWAILQL